MAARYSGSVSSSTPSRSKITPAIGFFKGMGWSRLPESEGAWRTAPNRRSLLLDVPVGGQQLGGQDRAARRAANRVVRQRDEAVVEHHVRSEAADADPHAIAEIAIEPRLRARIVLEVRQERLRRARQSELLGTAGVRT